MSHDCRIGEAWQKGRVLGPQVPNTLGEANEPTDKHGDLPEMVGAAAMADAMADAHGLEPRSLAEAMRSPAWPQWKDAMLEEHAALDAHKTWPLEKPPLRANVVGCQWAFVTQQEQSPGTVLVLLLRDFHKCRELISSTHMHQ
jgi:hypothetical protein